ncbi:MAG: endonuclease/exonuclease/phosphatase family protein [Bacteroidetes bacterium]|nr:endonuclease/exonuclease/phosphatase family protein [Bacteroidota bacterium]
MKRMLILLLVIILIPAIYVGGFILYGMATKFKPQPVEDVSVQPAEQPSTRAISSLDTLSFMTWNIGYGGLGAETDFFYDDGKMITTPQEWVQKYTKGIFATVKENQDADFIFIQEADRHGKRSWNVDEVAGIASSAPDHNYAFAVNFDVKYLPFPLEPWKDKIGPVYGGLLSLSRFMPEETQRISLPGIPDWPKKIFYLERCLMMQRFKLPNDKELVVVNTHFEAYDDGSVKKEQMALTKKLLEAEYAKGNYVVLGGDWNIAPPDFNVKKWEKEPNYDKLYEMNNDSNYIPGWKYVYDGNTPTNRKNSHAFDPNTTFTTVIDYFFVSPNVDVVEVKGINAGFEYSDHNPVRMKITLRPEHPVALAVADSVVVDSMAATQADTLIHDEMRDNEESAEVKKESKKSDTKSDKTASKKDNETSSKEKETTAGDKPAKKSDKKVKKAAAKATAQ